MQGSQLCELKSGLVTHSHCWHPGCGFNTTKPINQPVFKFLLCPSILMNILSPEVKKWKCKPISTVLNWQLQSSSCTMTGLSFSRTRASTAEKVPNCPDKKYIFQYIWFYMSSLPNGKKTNQTHSTNKSFDTDTVKCWNYFLKCFKY